MEDWLARDKGVSDPDVIKMVSLLGACSEAVAEILADTPVHCIGTSNAFGDAQLSVDVLADAKIFELLEKSQLVGSAASEEEPELRNFSSDSQKFCVCFDPLDGSSIVDCNWAVGSIFGVWPSSCSALGSTGRAQVLSAMTIYGPRLTMIVAIKGVCCFETTFVKGKWQVTNPALSIGENVKIFSPANLRATRDLPNYDRAVQDWLHRKLTLRYTGGMVPDIGGILIKGAGIFASPVSETAPAKLRLAFECAPVSLIVETAGGSAFADSENKVLDLPIRSLDDRTALVCGSATEVSKFFQKI